MLSLEWLLHNPVHSYNILSDPNNNMKRVYITLISILFINTMRAQNQANNWYFGYNAGINFSANPPMAINGGMLTTGEGCTTMSDASGNLLFYSDGVNVWDRTHSIMPNGTGLFGHGSSTQSALAVPMPGSTTLYYLFTVPALQDTNPMAYSIVDMALHSGFGDITLKNNTLLNSSTEKLTAVYHSNGTDIWIIVHGYPNNYFYAYLLTASGLNITPVASLVGSGILSSNSKAGYLKASSCGNKLAMANVGSFTGSTFELFDFDNTAGTVSNAIILGTWIGPKAYGCEFSPDNTKLYASFWAPVCVVQFDLMAGSTAAIAASMDTAGIPSAVQIGALQTGPDGRIYIAKKGDTHLAAIMNPNQPAASCGFIDNYLTLSATCYWGLPNFISSYFCNIRSSVNEAQQHEAVTLSPNPTTSSCTITSSSFTNSTLTLYDITGRTLLQQPFNSTAELNLSAFTPSIYIIELKDKQGHSAKAKVVNE